MNSLLLFAAELCQTSPPAQTAKVEPVTFIKSFLRVRVSSHIAHECTKPMLDRIVTTAKRI